MSKSSESVEKTIDEDHFQAPPQELKDAAFRLLARREQSQFELTLKLTSKGWPKAQVSAVVTELMAKGWQSDQRFISSFVRDKLLQGQGPLKIKAQAMQQKGVSSELVEQALEQELQEQQLDWRSQCRDSLIRKFGEQAPADQKQKARRIRYLQQRGFKPDDVFAVIDELER